MSEWIDVKKEKPQVGKWFVALDKCGDFLECHVIHSQYELDNLNPETCWFGWWFYVPRNPTT